MNPNSFWMARERALPLSKPLIMGILNVTPDSFSDGGAHFSHEEAVLHADSLLSDGADIIDIGGESTRPGFAPVSAEDELHRIVPAVEAIRRRFPDCWISIDTVKPSVAEAALKIGADIINDVSGAEDPAMLEIVQRYNAGYVVTHGWQEHLRLEARLPSSLCGRSVGDWTLAGLRELLSKTLAAEIPPKNIMIDPGFGFGKKGAQNAELLATLPNIVAAFAQPILIGVSRKHFLKDMYPQADGDNDKASAICAREALAYGGRIFRVHNAKLTANALGISLPQT